MSLMMHVSLHMGGSLGGEKGAEHPSQDIALRQQAEVSPRSCRSSRPAKVFARDIWTSHQPYCRHAFHNLV